MKLTFFITLILSVLFAAGIAPADPADSAIVSHIHRTPVESRGLAAIGYSRHLRALEIEFVNGAVYRYFDVSPAVYRDFLAAESKARFYHEHVRGKYRSVHVRTIPKESTAN